MKKAAGPAPERYSDIIDQFSKGKINAFQLCRTLRAEMKRSGKTGDIRLSSGTTVPEFVDEVIKPAQRELIDSIIAGGYEQIEVHEDGRVLLVPMSRLAHFQKRLREVGITFKIDLEAATQTNSNGETQPPFAVVELNTTDDADSAKSIAFEINKVPVSDSMSSD